MASDSHWWGQTSSAWQWNQQPNLQFQGSPASLGHGNACIVDLGGNLTVFELATGQQKACAQLPSHKSTSFSTLRGQNRNYNLTAHPTMEICFAITECALSVFSTKTAQVIKTLEFNNYLPKQCWSWTKLHFGKRPTTEGGEERAWLLCDAWNFAGQVWMHGQTSAEAVVTYEIDLGKLELVQVAIWKIAHHGTRLWTVENSQSLQRDNVEGIPNDFSGIHLRSLNPLSGTGCICILAPNYNEAQRFQLWTVKFGRASGSFPVPNSGNHPHIYEVENYQHITLPGKSPKKGGRKGGSEINNTKESVNLSHPRRRREFFFKDPPMLLDLHYSERYMAFTTRGEIYLFGFMPRW